MFSYIRDPAQQGYVHSRRKWHEAIASMDGVVAHILPPVQENKGPLA